MSMALPYRVCVPRTRPPATSKTTSAATASALPRRGPALRVTWQGEAREHQADDGDEECNVVDDWHPAQQGGDDSEHERGDGQRGERLLLRSMGRLRCARLRRHRSLWRFSRRNGLLKRHLGNRLLRWRGYRWNGRRRHCGGLWGLICGRLGWRRGGLWVRRGIRIRGWLDWISQNSFPSLEADGFGGRNARGRQLLCVSAADEQAFVDLVSTDGRLGNS